MKNYKGVHVFALVWGVICILGIIFTPDKTGFTERPLGTFLGLFVYPIFGAYLLVWLVLAIKKRW